MPPIDFTDQFGAHAARRLDTEQVVWLTTTDSSGQPNPNPVWFLRREARLLILSNSKSAKVRAIRANPKVAVSFNSTPTGGDVVVINGIAQLRGEWLAGEDRADYLAKYADGITGIGMTPETFADAYDQRIEVTLTRLRGFIGG
jgi:PPOX class probable F420-dependent enzyme